MLTMGFDPHRFAERDRKDRDQKRRDRAEAKRQRRMQRVAGEDIDMDSAAPAEEQPLPREKT
jgi:hypothetical protein